MADTYADALEQLALDHPSPWSTRAAADARAESNKTSSEQTARTTFDNTVFTATADFQATVAGADLLKSDMQTGALGTYQQAQSQSALTKATAQAADNTTAAAAGVGTKKQASENKPPEEPEDVAGSTENGSADIIIGGQTLPNPLNCTPEEWLEAFGSASQSIRENYSGDERVAPLFRLQEAFDAAGTYYRSRAEFERQVTEYERVLQQQRFDQTGAISASNKTPEEMARDEARFYRQSFSKKISWAFTITPESPDSDEKFAVRVAVYRVQGSMYGPIAGAPRQDVQVLLKGAGAVPGGLGVAALGLDATIHAYNGEWGQAGISTVAAGLNAWLSLASATKGGTLRNAAGTADDVPVAPNASEVPGVSRPGSISGNPANQRLETGTPLKSGEGWVRRWYRITPKDAQAYRNAVNDKLKQLYKESRWMSDEAARQYHFQEMSKFRNQWLKEFLENRNY